MLEPNANLLAPTAGLGLKPQHYQDAVDCVEPGLFFEVHPENYMVDGGPRLRWLESIRARHPLTLHGVGLSLGADARPEPAHLDRLRSLVQRFDPVLVSEHLAWSTWRGIYRPDLLPVPRTAAALTRLVANVSETQDALGRRILIENPAHYLAFRQHTFDEVEYLHELCRRSGCGLLLDVNNVWVSASNLGFDASACVDAFDAAYVEEIHVAGHSHDPALGSALLIDSHDTPVSAAVWRLYRRVIERIGPRPTVLERDGAIPTFAALLDERAHAAALLLRSDRDAA
jgi:uncharacterized protein (UPF0276 family)